MARLVRSPETAPAAERQRVLSIDPALRKTGYAIVEGNGRDMRAITWGVIQNKPALLPSGCLVTIRETLCEVIR
ncbi:MAG: crossover junction endodeoxyribonuclease RuvC, partial [Verrucomicrobiota bacterium]